MSNAEELLRTAKQYRKEGRLQQELEIYEQILAEDTGNVAALSGLGRVCIMLKMPETALRVYEILLTVNAGIETRVIYAEILSQLGQNEKALIEFQALEPKCRKNFDFLSGFGRLLTNIRRLPEAIDFLERAIKIKSEHPEGYNDLGRALILKGDFQRAIGCFQKAGKLSGGDDHLLFGLHACYQNLRDLKNGWKYYSKRLALSNEGSIRYDHSIPYWSGENLAGKKILIGWEQGIGDQLHFGAVLPELIEEADDVYIEVSPKLLDLFSINFPKAKVFPEVSHMEHGIGMAQKVTSYDWLQAQNLKPDYFSPIGDAFGWRRQEFSQFKNFPPYLKSSAILVSKIDEYFGLVGLPGAPFVGLSWRSSKMSGYRNAYFSTSEQFADMIRAIETPLNLVNLQYLVNEEELEMLRVAAADAGHNFIELEDFDFYEDLQINTALIQNLDYALFAPGNTQFLTAGAMGVPTFTLGYDGSAWSFGYKVFDLKMPSALHLDGDWVPFINQILSGEKSFVDVALQRFESAGDTKLILGDIGVENVDDWQQQYANLVTTRQDRLAWG